MAKVPIQNHLMGYEFIHAIGELLGVPVEHVTSITIHAQYGAKVEIIFNHIGDKRLIEYDWAKLKPNMEGTKPDAG